MSRFKFLENERFYRFLILGFLLLQFVIIVFTSVNIPVWDEWEYLRPQAFLGGLTWDFLFAFHNEHRGVFPRLQSYIFFKAFDWNINYQVYFNYILFCSMIYFLYRFQQKNYPQAGKGIWILLFFLTSPINADNHNWGFQSYFHYCLIFGLLSIFYATQEKMSPRDYIFASIFALFSNYSLGSGLFFALVVGGVLFLRSHGSWAKWGSLALLGIGMGLWFIGYQKPAHHPSYVFPYSSEFWKFFGNLISFGFGFKTTHYLIALISLIGVAVIMWRSTIKAFSFRSQAYSFPYFAVLSILGTFVAMTLVRAGFGTGQAKASRYAEVAFLLTPFIGWLWWRLAQDNQQKLRQRYKYFIFWVILGSIGNFNYSSYFEAQDLRKKGEACVKDYYRGINPAAECPGMYPLPLVEQLEIAKKLKLSWVPKEK